MDNEAIARAANHGLAVAQDWVDVAIASFNNSLDFSERQCDDMRAALRKAKADGVRQAADMADAVARVVGQLGMHESSDGFASFACDARTLANTIEKGPTP